MNRTWRRSWLGAGLALTLVLAACQSNTGSPSQVASQPASQVASQAQSQAPSQAPGLEAALVGAGASFPEPIYLEWIGAFQGEEPGVTINYQGIGSSGGREQLIALQVDFAGSDAVMNDEALAAAAEASGCADDVLHIPTVFGGVAVAYNVDGVDELILDGETIAQIGLGNITALNDPAIAALNPGVQLPDQALTWVHRSDGSGTTSIFTTYLNDVSDEWADQVGRGSEVEWPTGIGADQNDGVAAAIAQQPGGIGYVSYEFAVEAGIAVAAVVNADGNAVSPSTEAVSEAALSVDIPDNFRFNILGVGGNGYPIAGATWILAYTCGMDEAKADALKAFLTWALEDGDALAEELNYAPLPDDLEARVLEHIGRINEEG